MQVLKVRLAKNRALHQRNPQPTCKYSTLLCMIAFSSDHLCSKLVSHTKTLALLLLIQIYNWEKWDKIKHTATGELDNSSLNYHLSLQG